VTADTLMVALLGAFVTFSVFAGAFLAFLTGGDGLKKIADYWIERGAREASARGAAGRLTDNGRRLVVNLTAGLLTALIQVLSGLGLLTCGVWLVSDVGHDVAGWPRWTYRATVMAFIADALLITVLSVLAVALVAVTSIRPPRDTAPASPGAAGPVPEADEPASLTDTAGA
jgi:hypothetical protein